MWNIRIMMRGRGKGRKGEERGGNGEGVATSEEKKGLDDSIKHIA